MKNLPPVITIDGPSGSGKGTIAQLLAKALGWHFLDSGVLYRAIAWAVLAENVSLSDHDAIAALIRNALIEMPVSERGDAAKIIYNQQDITSAIRSPECSQMASRVSALPFVREALLESQRAMRQFPGLVTDGRDMGTVVFPDAPLKFYFEASAKERAKRRYNQLKEKGKHVSLPHIEEELRARDERDASRSVSPLKPAEDAIVIDTTNQDIEGVFQTVLAHVQNLLVDQQ